MIFHTIKFYLNSKSFPHHIISLSIFKGFLVSSTYCFPFGDIGKYSSSYSGLFPHIYVKKKKTLLLCSISKLSCHFLKTYSYHHVDWWLWHLCHSFFSTPIPAIIYVASNSIGMILSKRLDLYLSHPLPGPLLLTFFSSVTMLFLKSLTQLHWYILPALSMSYFMKCITFVFQLYR